MDISQIKEKLNNPEIEAERKRILRNLILTEIVLFFILYGGIYLLNYLAIQTEDSKIFEWIFGIFGLIYLFTVIFFFGNPFWTNKDFKEYLKEKCEYQIHKLFKLRKVKTGFSKEELKESNLFSNFTDIENDDIFNGTFEDISYKVSETNLISKGRKHEFTVFDGVIISLPSNKNFNTKTVITTKGDTNVTNNLPYLNLILFPLIILGCVPFLIFLPIILRLLAKTNFEPSMILAFISGMGPTILMGIVPIAVLGAVIFLYYKKKDKFKNTKTEDIVFDKRFKIHAQDQVEARYLITTGFMERLNELKLAFGTRNIKCSFFNNKIMITIQNHRDLFELGSLYKSCPNEKDIKRFYEEMLAIQKLITHLKLTNKTGL